MTSTAVAIATDQAPAALGPYSQAVRAGDYIYVSGQLGIDASTGTLAPDAAGQTAQAIRNIAAILAAAELSLADVVKTTVLLADIADFAAVNQVYANHFTATPLPARATYQVAKLPMAALVEIEAIGFSLRR